MKSIDFSRLAVSLLLVTFACLHASACGPFPPIIPTPKFFGCTAPHRNIAGYDHDENLRLWQSFTSDKIPLDDIEDVVYGQSWNAFFIEYDADPADSANLFYLYLTNTGDQEVISFLGLAKRMEAKLSARRSPWYYPAHRDGDADPDGFEDLIRKCKSYDGVRLRDRYALQTTRGLFASRKYAECIEYVDSAFRRFPDSNLMKRMARRYAAGCWSRIGETERADSIFAATGDIWSISRLNPVELMADINPEAPQLMEYIRCHAADTVFMRGIMPFASGLLTDRRVRTKGDWHFLRAYVKNEFESSLSEARREIRRAMASAFSSDELRDMARAYKMKLDGAAADRSSLLADLRWIESKMNPLAPDAEEWIRRCRNVIYTEWVPRLWQKKDYAGAILLCAYADNILGKRFEERFADNSFNSRRFFNSNSIGLEEMRRSEKFFNVLDYSSLSFQMMGSLTSGQLAAAYRRIMAHTPLFDFLRRKVRSDRDYYYEVIGTLALREENYSRAVSYLSKVSRHYLKTMNVYKMGYLSRDPFYPYPSRWESYSYADGSERESESATCSHKLVPMPEAKLDFARKMLAYKRKMQHGRSADERGIARLMYAMGRRNSFEECWALTQYWRGYTDLFDPILQYGQHEYCNEHYSFLYDYLTTVGHEATEKLYSDEMRSALAMLSTDEARAQANYILGNLPVIVRRYGNTATAHRVKTSCDNWRAWL